MTTVLTIHAQREGALGFVSENVLVNKRSALLAYKLLETLKRIKLIHPTVGYLGRHREDNIIEVWRYGKEYGKNNASK